MVTVANSKMRELRVGVLNSGLHHSVVFRSDDVMHIRLAPRTSIAPERFNLIIIPFHTDHEALGSCRSELERFVRSGGTLLVLGASDLPGAKWIPFCSWTHQPTRDTRIEESEEAVALFESIDADVQFHPSLHAHGALLPTSQVPHKILARGEHGRPVVLLIEPSEGGCALITTLDPDHHAAPLAITGKDDHSAEEDRGKANELLQRFIAYARTRAEEARAAGCRMGWDVPNATKIFLSHKGSDKALVSQYERALALAGYQPWLDERMLKAGVDLRKGIENGMCESCAAVFFISPNFKDENWLEREISLALQEKDRKRDRFQIITLVLQDEEGKVGAVPATLKNYKYETPESAIEGLSFILDALPLVPGARGWRLTT